MSFALFWAATALAAAPSTVQQQGRAFDATGAPLTGAYDVDIRLYDAEGAELWLEEHDSVDFTDGYYSVDLGSTVALDPAWQQAATLGVTVGTGSELARQPVLRTVDPLATTSCTAGQALQATEDGWSCGPSRTFLGSLHVTATYNGTPSSWTKFNYGYGYGWSYGRFNEYVSGGQVLQRRLCATYTDSGTGSGVVQVRFIKYNDGAQRWSTNLPTTASASSSIQNQCTSWEAIGSLSNCTYSWSNTCEIQVRHNQSKHTQIYDLWWEFSAL